MDNRDKRVAREWIEHRIRNGTSPGELHAMVDVGASVVLADALVRERSERHRADQATVERDEARAELERLREAIRSLPTVEPGPNTDG